MGFSGQANVSWSHKSGRKSGRDMHIVKGGDIGINFYL